MANGIMIKGLEYYDTISSVILRIVPGIVYSYTIRGEGSAPDALFIEFYESNELENF